MVKIQKVLSVATLLSVALALGISKVTEALEGSITTQYTSDLTRFCNRDVFVKQIHSHNDYWRDIPLYTALSYGVQSVEADVWHFEGDDTIYVGHHEAALNAERTFEATYINPLVQILTAANPNNTFTASETKPNGVFDTDSGATLYLWVDLKTDGDTLIQYVIKALEPLREKGWLTTYTEGEGIKWGPITVVGTGNTPYDFVSSQKSRDYFFDGPLKTLNSSYPKELNPIASASLKKLIGTEDININGLNDQQFDLLKTYIDEAHSQGIKTRLWDVPWWPVKLRNNLWRQILDAGSDFLNADDLEFASKFE
ncbi:putative secreted protein [Wickerhamomyces ciferrii]|uniref:Secreted protein n=1 Tax=Wickerhamomyces ciferrii (strain ATCC 14091 / BCRC 22168 / CBS 111 / JCM 3599 / NBRC 0793 / NRRL Y-1031 F-60-10) TaxID=1206466 RepID=K0KJJ5_WICCF|nr:uncharacterized protein BN7_1831 [Wickerhamomyces ciferrii]CCH42287.1 putative secreted protein [Wickerhamomyces ciferrii]